ncbi:ATP-binding protein [Geopsychrobacter electrodiphilus]|uniref:ATP-binding protein n=1 Tax=Geopsychrobacter electrodiphilus TaxID=225196 RepID=UPI00036E68E0|nr:ATP-binding protein [Geopsychrobacter electrodiphilus]
MKKYALLGLILMLCCFIGGGVYIISSINDVTGKLEKVISFHRVEFLREKLINDIKVTQTDLLLQGSPHEFDVETAVQHVNAMEEAINICFTCHHPPETTKLFTKMKDNIKKYMALISKSLTLHADQPRLEAAKMAAFARGEAVLNEVNTLSIASADKISSRIDTIRADIHATNTFLIACVILGPLAIIFITVFFLRRFTGSIDTLVEATRELEAGDLEYRIKTPLKNEFKTLASRFNSMVDSLNTERQKFESVHTLYQTLFESAGDAIMITSLEGASLGRIVSANTAACNLHGYSINEILGMNIVKLVPEHKEERFRERMKAALNGEWTHLRAKRKKKNGTLFPVDLSLGMFQLDKQKYLLTFCKDISETLQAEEELQRANQMALVGQMAAGLAHEIKNPLAGVKVSLDVLSDELELKAEDKDLFARIINEINRMERLLKSLLNYARPPMPQFDRVDLNQLLDSSIKNVEVTAANGAHKKILFVTDLDHELPQVEADPSQLQQVFLNIYLNAIDAMEDGGTITTLTRLEGAEAVRIQISDTGKGLPEAVREKLFTPFFTTKSKGTGLGLAICKRLVEQHGGRIEVESRVEEGTDFVCFIPLVQKFRE